MPRRPRAGRPRSRRSRSGTGCRRRCPDACPGSDRDPPRRCGAARRTRSRRGGRPRGRPRCGRCARCRPPRRWGWACSHRRIPPRWCTRPAPARSRARLPRSSPCRRWRSRRPRGRAARAACRARSAYRGPGRGGCRGRGGRRPARASRSCRGTGSSYPLTVTSAPRMELDYIAPELTGERFHETINQLRKETWLARSELGWFVLDREAGSFFLRTKSATFPGLRIAEMFGVEEGPILEEMRRNILHINGDAHRRLRNLVNPAFTPRAADRWRPAMREFLERLWAPLEGTGRCEFVADFAKPYPSLTIATVMGAPLDDAPKLHEWSNLIQRQFDPHGLTYERDAIERACAEFYEWAGALIERRRDDPGDDLISTLIEASHDGDRLDDTECMNLVLNVLVGGVDTTQSQLAQALRLFAIHA